MIGNRFILLQGVEMKRVLDTSEVLGKVDTPDGTCEVCASADANYDDTAGRLVVRLESFLRTTDLRSREKHVPAHWLPKPETITESVASDETTEAARNIFHRWVRKVRQAAPSLHSPTF
jgi:hypothetical protein